MKHLDVVLAAMALSCFSLPPASALADDALDDLDVTMEVLDNADRVGDPIPEVLGTGEAAYLEHDAYEDPQYVDEPDDELVDDGEFSSQDEYSEEDDGFEDSDGWLPVGLWTSSERELRVARERYGLGAGRLDREARRRSGLGREDPGHPRGARGSEERRVGKEC